MNDSAPSLSKLQHEKSLRKPYAGNLQVRFDEEEGAARPPLLTLLPLCFKKFFAEVELGFPVLVGTAERIDARIVDSEQEIQTLLATIHPNECCTPWWVS